MNTSLLGANVADRLVENLAGSSSLLTGTTGGLADLPLSLISSAPCDDTTGTAPPDQTGGVLGSIAPVSLLDPVTSLLDGGDANGGSLPVIGSLLGNSGLADGSNLNLAGPDGILQPVLNAADVAIKDVHGQALESLSDTLGVNDLVHNVVNTGETLGLGRIGTAPANAPDGHTNLLTDVLNAPATLLDDGLGTVVSQLGNDLANVVHATGGIVNSLLNTPDGLNVLPTLLDEIGHDLQSLPLLTLNGGNNDGDGGLLGGLLGNLHGSSSGHLIDVDVGPEQANGQSIDLLATPTSGDHHTLELNAVDVGQNGPQLLDLGALTGADGINIPSLGGSGTDGLIGNLLGGNLLGGHLLGDNLLGGGIASGNTTTAPVSVPVDVTAMLHDLVSGPLITDHGILDTHGTHIL